MHTPVSIYLKVRDMYPQSALMESSDYHAGENSLSFIALCPLASIGINGGIVTSNYPDNIFMIGILMIFCACMK